MAATFAKIETALFSIFAKEGLHVFEMRWEHRPNNTNHLSADIQSFWGGHSLEFKIADAEKALQYRGHLDRFHTQALALNERRSKIFSVGISLYE